MKLRMTAALIGLVPLVCPTGALGFAQHVAEPGDQREAAPIYRVTVVERTAKAINYQYRSGPTKIDFRGTVLLPQAKGEATVESRQGRTSIHAKLKGLTSPQRFGDEYLTYVLWAITPEGRPHNIGELIPNSSDKARIEVTTDLQSFALIVTAEPYSAVRRPSDVVVAENEVRSDTVGDIEPVIAKYELLPRGTYTWHIPSNLGPAPVNTPRVSTHEYDALIELYQAQNAVWIADNAKADQFAPDTLARAKQLLAQAQRLHDQKADYRQVIDRAREASETAEDARLIAERREQSERIQAADAKVSMLHAQLSSAEQAKLQAQQQAQQAEAEAQAAQMGTQAAIAARNQADAQAQQAREQAAQAQFTAQESNVQAAQDQQRLAEARKHELRASLLADLNGVLPTLDTGRGLIATVPDQAFRGAMIDSAFSDHVGQIAAILTRHPDLHVTVQGYSDTASGQALSQERADTVRRVLIEDGVAGSSVSAVGLGDSRPVVSNRTMQGRRQNRRVEIVITGDSIGRLPLWDKTYTLTGSTARFPEQP